MNTREGLPRTKKEEPPEILMEGSIRGKWLKAIELQKENPLSRRRYFFQSQSPSIEFMEIRPAELLGTSFRPTFSPAQIIIKFKDAATDAARRDIQKVVCFAFVGDLRYFETGFTRYAQTLLIPSTVRNTLYELSRTNAITEAGVLGALKYFGIKPPEQITPPRKRVPKSDWAAG